MTDHSDYCRQMALLFAPPPPTRLQRWRSKLLWHLWNKRKFVDLGYIDE
jgi:hypothetical protein